MSLKRKNIRTTPTTITPILTYTDVLLTNSRSQNRLVSEQKNKTKARNKKEDWSKTRKKNEARVCEKERGRERERERERKRVSQ